VALRVAGDGAAIATETAMTNDIIAHAIPAREKLRNICALLSEKTTAVINLRSRRSLSQSHDLRQPLAYHRSAIPASVWKGHRSTDKRQRSHQPAPVALPEAWMLRMDYVEPGRKDHRGLRKA